MEVDEYYHGKVFCTFIDDTFEYQIILNHATLENYPPLSDIKSMNFSSVSHIMHLLIITVYSYAPGTTCDQQVFHSHSSETYKLINITCVYLPTIRFCGRFVSYHVICGDDG